jgi:hypothetical protein
MGSSCWSDSYISYEFYGSLEFRGPVITSGVIQVVVPVTNAMEHSGSGIVKLYRDHPGAK